MGCLNLTNMNEPVTQPYAVQTLVLLSILVGMLILLTWFGNIMVVIAVVTSRALKAPHNLFLVSLACADILVFTLAVPFSLANELMGYWYFGQVWCVIHLALDVLFCTSSIVHLCVISLDRYWSVARPIEYNMKRSLYRIKCIICLIWVLATLISIPSVVTMKEGEKDKPVCQLNQAKWYIIFSSTASFFAPCFIMIMVYIRIYQIVKNLSKTRALPGGLQKKNGNLEKTKCGADPQEKEEKERNEDEICGFDEEEDPSSSSGNETNLCLLRNKRSGITSNMTQVKPKETLSKVEDPDCVKPKKGKQRQYRERRFTFLLAVVIGVFVLCWFPFFFTYTLAAVCDTCCIPEALFKTVFWLGYCNSFLNPVIYTVFNKEFRDSFKKILCKRIRGG
uniref:Alpha-2A adrenergic receptor n=1 Tax=Cyprinodon variegatus TaxID=28743 RepID=A0A3Q2G417_CYPVA